MRDPNARNFVERLAELAIELPDTRAFTYLDDGENESATLSYGELHRRALAIGCALRGAGIERGERALLLFAPGLDFIAAFFGCLYAGVIAVPAYPPDPGRIARTLPRLLGIVRDATPRCVLTSEWVRALASAMDAPELASVPWIAVDGLDEGIIALEPPQNDDVAFLQYTSGSTAAPKGVMVTHGNLVANSRDIASSELNDETSCTVSWLPTFHDMGLIDGVLQPIWGAFPSYLMSPGAFLQRPARWLEAITRYRATNSGGPNFGYALCLRKVSDAEHARLDLSTWRVAYNGAEPARWPTMERFIERFASRGFDMRGLAAVYGMAEATLFVSGRARGDEPRVLGVDRRALEQGEIAPGDLTLPSCGMIKPSFVAWIVDPASGQRLPEDRVGEICIRGAAVARGYFGDSARTAAAFNQTIGGEQGFFRTGDLGFFHDGELYVTGRIKDLLIIRGRNIVPSDVEATVEGTHGAIRGGCVVAFSLQVDDSEALGIAAEVEPGLVPDLDQLIAEIRQNVVWRHEVAVAAIALLKPRTIPKTSSGKLRRRATRDAFFAGTLETIRVDRLRALEAPWTPPAQAWCARSADGWDAERLAAAVEHALETRPKLRETAFVPESTPEMGIGFGSFAVLDVKPARMHETLMAAAFNPTGAAAERPLRVRLLRSTDPAAERHALVVSFPRGTTTPALVRALCADVLDAYERSGVTAPRTEPAPRATDGELSPHDDGEIRRVFAAWLARIDGEGTQQVAFPEVGAEGARWSQERATCALLRHEPLSVGPWHFAALPPPTTPFKLMLVYGDGYPAAFGYDAARLGAGAGELTALWYKSFSALLSRAELIDPETRATLERLAQASDRAPPPARALPRALPDAPDALLRSGDDELRLRDLVLDATRGAQRLLARGVARGDAVAIVCPPGLLQLRALAQVWLAGARALLIPPESPEAFATQQIEIAGARWLLRGSNELQGLGGLPALMLDGPDEGGPAALPELTLDDGAAIVTVPYEGRDELVALTLSHGVLARQAATWRALVAPEPGQTFALRAPAWSVHAYVEAAAAMLGGHAVYAAEPNDLRCHASFGARADSSQVSGVAFVPFLTRALMSAMLDGAERMGHYRHVLLRGEVMPPELLEKLRGRMPHAHFQHAYGCAEVGGLALSAEPGEAYRALPGIVARVLDAQGALLPPGMSGELCLGGALLAAGVPEARRVRDPLSGASLFRTGDSARLLLDGGLELGGRRDSQDKIAGMRVVRSRLTALLKRHPELEDAHVERFRDPRGELRLHAYVVTRDPALDETALRRAMRKQVPEPALPSGFTLLTTLPRNPAGEVDVASLPPPPWLPERRRVEPPATDTERRLAAIWALVLGVSGIGRDQSFFELGGDSLLGLQVAHEAEQRGLPLRPEMITQYPKLRDLAAALDQG